jgi:glyoxylase-like metal-dependent hydrolase (beta-lactamase superfamily II)
MSGESRHAWAESRVERVADGVYRIPLPLPSDALRAVNVYAVLDDEGVTLIDAGWALAQAKEELGRALKGLDRGFGDIREFFVTHVHRDHYTMAVEIRRTFGTRVSLGERERDNLLHMRKLIDGTTPPGYLARLRRGGAASLIAEIQEPVHDDIWDLPDRWLKHDATLDLGGRSLRVVATPGHTSGHVVFHDSDAGLLFAGDHVLPHITPSIGFQPAPYAGPLGDYLDSLRLMLTLPDARLLPAHGPVVDSVHTRVHELLGHHERRLDEALAGTGEAATAYQVAQVVPWTRHKRHFKDLALFDQILAINETGAHLDVLATRGQVTAGPREDGAVVYRRR